MPSALASAQWALPPVAALGFLLGARPARAQARDTSGFAAVTDASYFAQYHSAPKDTLSPAAY